MSMCFRYRSHSQLNTVLRRSQNARSWGWSWRKARRGVDNIITQLHLQSKKNGLRICPALIIEFHLLMFGKLFEMKNPLEEESFSTVNHACRKRRLKWVATLPLGDINTEAWSSGMGVGRGLTTLPCKKENCWEASKKFSRIFWRRPRPRLGYGAKEREEIRIHTL
jgi:hypothetical protein